MADSITSNGPHRALSLALRFGSARTIANQRTATSPGLYAWYVPPPAELQTREFGDINAFFSLAASGLGADHLKGTRYTADLLRIPVERSAHELSPTVSQALKGALPAVSLFSGPLYVGYTRQYGGVSQRISEHLQHGPFKERLAALIRTSKLAGHFAPGDMLIKYFDLDVYLNLSKISLTQNEKEVFLKQLEETTFCLNFPFLNSKESN